MTWHEAMERFGSDKPDLRIDLELVSVDDLMADVEFMVVSGPGNDEKGRVAGLRVPGGAKISRKEIDDLTKYVSNYGARGLAWIKVNDKAIQQALGASSKAPKAAVAFKLAAEQSQAKVLAVDFQVGRTGVSRCVAERAAAPPLFHGDCGRDRSQGSVETGRGIICDGCRRRRFEEQQRVVPEEATHMSEEL